MKSESCLRWLAVALVGLPLGAQPVPLHAQRGAPQNGEWRTYGGDPGNSKYSPLDQITRDNFSRLRVVWRWKSVDGFSFLKSLSPSAAPFSPQKTDPSDGGKPGYCEVVIRL